MKVAFICVNFNNVSYTIDFVKSIKDLEYDGSSVEIIIVDNASKDNSIEKLIDLEKSNENITVIYSEDNVGYFKGLNLGLRKIQPSNYEYIIVGNNDLYFQKEFLHNLALMKFEDNVLVVAPNIVRLDGIHQNPHIVNKFGVIERVYRRLYFSNYYFSILLQKIYNMLRSFIKPVDRVGFAEEQIIVMGYGACYILTKSFFSNFKELDAPNFLMGEEGVLANQVLSRNGVTLYCPNLIVKHHDHSSIGKVSSKKLYGFSRESYYYYLKHLKHLH